MANVAWEDIAKQASVLSPTEKAQLIAWLSTSLSQELSDPKSNEVETYQSNDALTWTDDEIRQLMNRTPIRPAEAIAWLDANPPTEPWGDLRDDEDAAEYVHRKRRQSWSTSADALPGDNE